MADEKLIFPIGFDLEEGVAQVEKDWGKMQKKLQDTFKSQTIQVDADISKAVLDKLYAKFEGLIKTMESKAPQIKLKIPDTVDFEQEINRLKVQLKSINLGELTDAESKDLYLYIRQLEALAKALKEVNKQEQLRQANRPEGIALKQAQAEEKRTRSLANSALAEQRRAKIATESARQDEINNRKKMRASVEQARIDEINNRSAQRGAVIAEQKRAATARAENAELRLTRAKERSTQATHEQNAAYKTQSGYLQRLFQRMVAYASVAQAFSFIRNIREVTAEFELQRVALGALIQDGYKANAIFEQIKIKAVESPYEIKDLVTYTKQLAAYGVEADDLIGTMNKLADISAGLGTDMNRIILAYGQIQAAGVLKGTELRQLTELGLPMVDLLAEYYSTLRNEVVSTSEVFDMISNKEIPFQAVQDILNDLTSEGGRFYQMQTKQAETLAGQWSNMKDTLSIMFDEIGRSEEVRSLMEGMIDVVKWLALNWREVWQSIKLVGGTYAILKSLTLAQKLYNASVHNTAIAEARLLSIKRSILPIYASLILSGNALRHQMLKTIATNLKSILSFKALGAAMKGVGVAIKGVLKSLASFVLSNPVGAIMSLVSGIGIFKLATSEGRDAMDAFREQQREMVKESVENSALLESNFKRLAKEVVNSVDGSERQRQALRRLKQQYGDIFPEWKLTVDYLQKISEEANGASTAFDAMASSISSFVMEKTRQTLMENYMSQVQNQFKDTFANLTDNIGLNYAEAIGFIVNNFDKYANIDEFINELNNKYAEAMGTTFSSWRYPELRQAYDPNYYDYNLLKNLAIAYFNIDEEVNKLISDFDKLDPKAKESANRLKDLGEALKTIQSSTGGENAEQVSSNVENATTTAIREALLNLQKEGLKGTNWTLGGLSIDLSTEEMIDKLERIFQRAKVDDIFMRELEQIKAMAGLYDDVWKSDLANMRTYLDDGSRLVQAYSADQIQSFNDLWDAIPEVAKRYKELDEELEGLSKTYDALKSKPIDEQDTQEIEKYRKEISKIEAIMKMLHSFLEKYGGLDLIKKEDTNKVNPDIKKLEDEYAMVEKIYKKYEEFRKFMGDEQARIEVEKYFEGVDLQWLDKAFSTDELKSQAQKALRILTTFGGDTEKAQQNLQFKIGDIDFDDTKRELERKMAKLSEDLSRTKTAKDFFDRMLGMTGDKELSATLTLSVYGTTGDDLQKLMTQQILEAFKGVDISEAMLGGNKWDYNVLAGFVEQLPEDQQKNAQSIVDNWRKANADILTDLQKSYEDFMTYEERKTRVAEKYVAERKKIEESQYDKNEKDKLLQASREAEKKELGAIAIEEFKASDDWIKSFEDLESLATPTIERLMLKLKEFITLNKEALTPEQLKSLMGEYDKLYNGLITRNPIQAITDSIKEYKEAMQGVSLAQGALDAAKAMGDEDLIAWAERGLTDALDEANKATSKLQKGLSGLSDKFSQAQQFVSSFTDTLGISEDTQFGAFLNGISDALGGVSKALAFAQLAVQLFDGTVKTMLKSNPIGWILVAVSAVVSAVQAIANARVKRIDQDIERLEDRLDSLSYAYDRLQKAQEKAFGTEYIQNYQRQLENLEAQQEAYLKQAELERSKGKKADEDKIKEYEEQARDTVDAIKDMYGSLSEKFLGSDLTSAARDFASAWIDAYKEFSNTTDAMKAKFQDMIQNMVVESLLAKVMERALEPVFTMIDEMQEGDFYSPSFWQDVMATMQTATENGVVGAENVMSMLEQMGINLRGLGGEMTGISRDIATASEESILGLAAGINTQNFYISQVPTKLDTIIGLLRGDGAMPQGSAMTLQDVMIAQNQFLSHLPTIAQHTANIVSKCETLVAQTTRTADALERVIKPDGTRTTYKMNVVTTYQG